MSKWIVSIGLALWTGLSALGAAEPKPDDFVTIKDGHLHRHGKRVRYWATNLLFIGDKHHKDKYSTNYESIDAGVERLKRLGYNAVRYWACAMGDFDNYTKGDRSVADYSDYFIYRLKQEGFVVWTAGLNFQTKAPATPADVDVIEDPATAEAWSAAVSENPRSLTHYAARAWDPRLRQLNLRQVKRYLDHYNQYTGLHAYEDPVYAVWELTNEEWWASNMLQGSWMREPEFFRRQLLQRWNDWLKQKYGTTASLKKAWFGLLDGESLEAGTVAFAPMSTAGVDPQMAILGAGNLKQAEGVALTMENFANARGQDVMQFILELNLAYKKEIEDFIRGYGKPGIGCQIVPILWDTGMANQLPAAFLHAQAPATAAGCYIRGIQPEKQDPRFPWRSGLREAPKLCYDNPWLEQNRVEGKPHFIYEVNMWNPSKYRAEFPYQVAALASIQDWDWVSWYQFDGFRRIDKAGEPNPYGRLMNYDYDAHHWNGVYYIFDEVLQSAMKGAGHLFTGFAAAPVAKPTTFRFGKQAIYDMNMQHYRGLHEGRNSMGTNLIVADAFAPTTWRYGCRLAFDPAGDYGVKIDGPVVRDARFLSPVIKPTDQIALDWHTGYLQFDTPSAKAVAGFLPEQWSFADGVALENITVHHPKGQSYVIPGERFAAIAVAAEDGKPLAGSGRITLTAVSTSFNAGFQIREDLMTPTRTTGLSWGAPYKDLFTYRSGTGQDRPVLVSRVGLTLRGKFLRGKTWTLYDWHLKVLGTGAVSGDAFVLSADRPVSFVTFEKP